MRKLFPASVALLLLLCCLSAASAANFTCTSTGKNATCRSVVGYKTTNATTYGAVQSQFQVPILASLLGANNLPLATSRNESIAAGSTVFVPIRCRCANGTGRSDGTPVYTVQEGDQGLYNIAYYNFGNLVSYQEIGEYNNLSDVNKITVGEKLWIPLPCSCDAVDGEEVVHLAHRVASGSTVEAIAEEFGTTASTIMSLNGISNEKDLQADQILDVPLRACSSSISNSSVDYGFRLANYSYDLTANQCILCSCSSTTYQLECYQTKNSSSSQCVIPTCQGNLYIGNSSTSGCETTTCSYAGYTNTSSIVKVLAIATNETKCTNGGSSRLELMRSKWAMPLVFLHMIWLSFL